MVKALVLLARFAALNIRLAFTKNRGDKFRMICEFERKCK